MSDTIQSDRAAVDSNQAAKGALPQEAGPRTKRKLLLSLLGAAIVISAAGYGAYYYTDARFYQSTEDRKSVV